jgi:DNA-3-methyladenine glycosylase
MPPAALAPRTRPLPRTFYVRPTVEVARDLLGKILYHRAADGLAGGRIVEVEAYLGEDDPASHAFRGPTPRARVMFEEGGRAYVYFSYGAHWCMNVVTERAGKAGAVLVRALEPLAGIALMQARRGRAVRDLAAERALRELCSGPGKLTQALAITRAEDGADLVRSPLFLAEGPSPAAIAASPRIGISRNAAAPLRFFDAASPFVSRRARRP